MTTRPTTWRHVSSVVLAVAGAGLAVVVVASDVADSDHSAWRDPLSYFGSPGAPHPAAFNAVLAATGLGLLGWSAARAREGPRLTFVFTGVAGLAGLLLALWPIDCSPVDDLCEVLIRGDVTSGAHDLHSYVGVVFFMVLSAVAAENAVHERRSSGAAGRRSTSFALAAVCITGTIVLVVWAFSAGSGAVEMAVGAAAAGALRVRLSSANGRG